MTTTGLWAPGRAPGEWFTFQLSARDVTVCGHRPRTVRYTTRSVAARGWSGFTSGGRYVIAWVNGRTCDVCITFHRAKNGVRSGIRTHAPEETGALNQRLRPLGHPNLIVVSKT